MGWPAAIALSVSMLSIFGFLSVLIWCFARYTKLDK